MNVTFKHCADGQSLHVTTTLHCHMLKPIFVFINIWRTTQTICHYLNSVEWMASNHRANATKSTANKILHWARAFRHFSFPIRTDFLSIRNIYELIQYFCCARQYRLCTVRRSVEITFGLQSVEHRRGPYIYIYWQSSTSWPLVTRPIKHNIRSMKLKKNHWLYGAWFVRLQMIFFNDKTQQKSK